jgi:acetylornithine deacetylase
MLGLQSSVNVDDSTAEKWVREELATLVGIPSPSGREEAIIRHLEARADELGLPARLVETPGGVPNLVLGSAAQPVLVIVAHVDTVEPPWGVNCEVEVDGHELRGLGAVDDKGGVVACLLALRLLQAEGVDLAGLPAAIAFAVDEEKGGTGSMALAEALRPAYAIALEGTRLQPATVECGSVSGSFHLTGVGCHGACPEAGENAVLAAGRLLAALESLELAPPHALAGRSTVVPFEITGGSSLYAVPESCRVRFGARLAPGVTCAQAVEALERVATAHGAQVVFDDDVSGAFEIAAASPLLTQLTAAIEGVTHVPPEARSMPCWTDAHSFVDIAGSAALVFGPGDLLAAHRPDEHIDLREVVQAARIFASLLAPASLARLAPAAHPSALAEA